LGHAQKRLLGRRNSRTAAQQARHRRQRQLVALAAEAADDPARGAAYEGIVAEFLAAEDVREMHLDDRQGGGGERVEDGYGGVGIGAGVEDDAVGALPRLLDPVDELALVVRLAEIDRKTDAGGTVEAGILD